MNYEESHPKLNVPPGTKAGDIIDRVCFRCGKNFVGRYQAKQCDECGKNKRKDKEVKSNKRHRQNVLNSTKEKDHCLFCNKTTKIHVHHIDSNHGNNDQKNLVLLCGACHRRLHGRIYNRLFKKFFKILIEERFTYHDIAKMFGTTRQNIYMILKK